jgi:iron(III) transport system substrate-binding protein
MANPNTSGTAYNVITTLRYVYNSDENRVFDYLRRLDANIDQYTRSGSAPGQSLAIGEIPIAIGYAHDHVRLKANGANIEINSFAEGGGFELASMSLIRGGKEPIQARQLYDWVLSSPNAQQLFVDMYLVLVRNGARAHPLALRLDQIKTVNQDFAWDGDAANRKRLLDRWTAEIESRR